MKWTLKYLHNLNVSDLITLEQGPILTSLAITEYHALEHQTTRNSPIRTLSVPCAVQCAAQPRIEASALELEHEDCSSAALMANAKRSDAWKKV